MIQIQIWANFECPYSYFQTIVLEKLQAKYLDRLEIVWRAFELTPVEGNISPSQSYIDNLEAAKSEPIVKKENLKLLTPKFLTYTWLAQERRKCSPHNTTRGIRACENFSINIFGRFFVIPCPIQSISPFKCGVNLS